MTIPQTVALHEAYRDEADTLGVSPSFDLCDLADGLGIGDDPRALRAALAMAHYTLSALRTGTSEAEMVGMILGLAEQVTGHRSLDLDTSLCSPEIAALRSLAVEMLNDPNVSEGDVRLALATSGIDLPAGVRAVESARLTGWVEPHLPTVEELERGTW